MHLDMYRVTLSLLQFWILHLVHFSSSETSVRTENCTESKGLTTIEAYISPCIEDSSSNGLAQVVIPDISPHLHYICFPKPHLESYRQFSYLAHVFCRQLGYMTYATWYDREVRETEALDLKPDDFRCQGYEQFLGQCEWDEILMNRCDQAMAVQCHACRKTIDDTEGIITNPGFPYAYFYTLLCEWHIVVPEEHEITFTFRKFHLPIGRQISCEDESPFLEFVSASGKVRRFCATKDSAHVRFSNEETVKVRFFSGVYFEPPIQQSKNYGFSIFFKAEEIHSHESPLIRNMIIILASIVAFWIVGCFFHACRKCFSSFYRGKAENEVPVPLDDVFSPSSNNLKTKEIFLRPPSSQKENFPSQINVSGSAKKNRFRTVTATRNADGNFCISNKTWCTGVGIKEPGSYESQHTKRCCRPKLKTIFLKKVSPRSIDGSPNFRTVTPVSSSKKLGAPQVSKGLDFQIYQSLSSASEIDDEYCSSKRGRFANSTELCGSPSCDGSLQSTRSENNSNSTGKLPTIVVECVDDHQTVTKVKDSVEPVAEDTELQVL